MDQQRYDKGTWHGKPIWQCLGCNETLFGEAAFRAHWDANHIERVELRDTGLVDPKGNAVLVEQARKAEELETWRQGALAAKAQKVEVEELFGEGFEDA